MCPLCLVLPSAQLRTGPSNPSLILPVPSLPLAVSLVLRLSSDHNTTEMLDTLHYSQSCPNPFISIYQNRHF